MSISYTCADAHLGQSNIITYRGQFASVEEHDEAFFDSLSIIRPNDTLYMLGDMAKSKEALERLAAYKFNKIYVPGNHCTEWHTMEDLVRAFGNVHACLYRKIYGSKLLLTHIPCDPLSLRGGFSVHGHEHYGFVNDPRYACVSLEHTDHGPIRLESVVNKLTASCHNTHFN